MGRTIDVNTLVRENIKALQPYSSARSEFDADGASMILLDANESPYENGLNRYPDPKLRTLRSALATEKGVQGEQVLFGNGSDEIMDLIVRAFCEPGKDNIITLPPTFGMFRVVADINVIENRTVLLTPDFQPDTEAILKAADAHSKLLFLCTPNNPTGNSFSVDTLTELLEKFNGLVVIDEAYIDFSRRQSWVNRLDEYQNLIVTQTLSKAYGMAGIRLGICYASKDIIAMLGKIKMPYNINELTQKRALQRLGEQEKIQEEITAILSERDRLFKRLPEFDFVEKVYPSDTNFLLVKVDDAGKRYDQMLEKGIVVRNRSKQPLCENTLRITVGTVEENEKMLAVFKLLEK